MAKHGMAGRGDTVASARQPDGMPDGSGGGAPTNGGGHANGGQPPRVVGGAVPGSRPLGTVGESGSRRGESGSRSPASSPAAAALPVWPEANRVAVCIAGEQRSATCPPSDPRASGVAASPLDSIRHFLGSIGPRDVFVVLDPPPSTSDASLADAGPTIGPSLVDSATRATKVFAAIKPVDLDFEDARRAETEYWDAVRRDVCVKPGAAFQARKLQSCWRMIAAREATQRFSYSHVIRLRPDLLVPRSLARHVLAHVSESRAGVRAQASSPELTALSRRRRKHLPHRMPTHGWGDEVCLRRHERSGATCQVKCDATDAEAPADLLTLPPFTPVLRNDTFSTSPAHAAPPLVPTPYRPPRPPTA